MCAFILAKVPSSHPETRSRATLIPGDGVGPELCHVVMDVFKAAGIISWDEKTHGLLKKPNPFFFGLNCFFFWVSILKLFFAFVQLKHYSLISPWSSCQYFSLVYLATWDYAL